MAQLGHSSNVERAAFSPDGTRIVTASYDGTARVWDARTGKELLKLEGHSREIYDAAFSPDGTRIVTASDDGTARVWDAQTGKELLKIEDHSFRSFMVASAAFSPDGTRIVTASGDKTARVWDARTGKELLKLEGHFEGHSWAVLDAAFSPDGTRIVTASGHGPAQVWDARTGKELLKLEGHSRAVLDAAFSPDGTRIVTASYDNSAHIWDARIGKELMKLQGDSSLTFRASFSPDGTRIVTALWGDTLQVWDARAGKEYLKLRGLRSGIRDAKFSPSGNRIVIALFDESYWVWDVTTDKVLAKLEFFPNNVWDVSFSPDENRIVTSHVDGFAQVWDVNTGKALVKIQSTFNPPPYGNFQEALLSGTVRAAFSPDGNRIVTANGHGVGQVWNSHTGAELVRLEGSVNYAESVAYSPDGQRIKTESFRIAGYMMGSTEKFTGIWDARTGKELVKWRGKGRHAVFFPDSNRILTEDLNGIATVMDIRSGAELGSLGVHSMYSTSFSSDGKWIISACTDGVSRVWDSDSYALRCSLISFRDGTWAVTTPEGRYDASNGGKVEGLHWVYSDPEKGILEPIDLSQFAAYYYEPGLLGRIMRGEKLAPLPDLQKIPLYPSVEDVALFQTTVTAKITDRGGGIGLVRVKLNGQEVATFNESESGPSFGGGTFSYDLGEKLRDLAEPKVEVLAYNKEGSVRSRDVLARTGKMDAGGTEPRDTSPARLYAVIAGIEQYGSDQLRLSFADDDAVAIAKALLAGANGLEGVEPRLYLLCDAPEARAMSSNMVRVLSPTKDSFDLVFTELSQEGVATENDLLLVYLSGHGTAIGGKTQTYLYLMPSAKSGLSGDFILKDARKQNALSSDELVEWMKKIRAGKRAVILDTCAAGASTDAFLALKDRSTDQARAVREFQDRTGVFALLGSPGNLYSYEAPEFGHGLLTYAMLYAMKHEDLGSEVMKGAVLIDKLFGSAGRRVQDLARELGREQSPLMIAPKGESFPIALFTDESRALIPLTERLPVLIRPQIINPDTGGDDLDLSGQIAELLRTSSATRGGGGSAPFAAFSGLPDIPPGGYRLQGIYAASGDTVTMKLSVWTRGEDGKPKRLEPPMPELKAAKAEAANKVFEALRDWLKQTVNKPAKTKGRDSTRMLSLPNLLLSGSARVSSDRTATPLVPVKNDAGMRTSGLLVRLLVSS